MKHLTLLITIVLLSSCSSDGQHKKVEYKIDPSITAEVLNNTGKQKKIDIGSMEIRYYENDSLITESFSNDKRISFWIMQKHSKSIIEIDGIVGMFDAWGFQLQITKEKFKVNYFSGADFNIYKKHKRDTVLMRGINLKCKASLALTKSPAFGDEEEISGIIEFTTPVYWEVHNGVEKKIRLEGKAYFATKLIEQKKP